MQGENPMAEIRIKVEIQDANGNIRKRVTLGVSENITRSELSQGIKSHFGDIVKDDKLEILIEPSENGHITGKLVEEGGRVIVRPRPSASLFRVLDEE